MNLLGEFKGELDIRYIRLVPRVWWLRWLPQRRVWKVLQPVTWCGPPSFPICVTVPADTITDFASIPIFVLFLAPTHGIVSDYGRAALVHDVLYQRGASFVPPVTRQQADEVFYHAMLCEEVLWPTRFLMWAAVRLFGWTAYRR